MMPKQHAAISAGWGALGWAWSGTIAALGSSVLVGVALDFDHAVDYAYYRLSGEQHRLLLPLHAYEWAIPLWLITRFLGGHRLAWATVGSFLLHLLADQWENKTKPGTYFITYRLLKGFRLEALSRDPEAALTGREDDMAALKRLFGIKKRA
jgi:hypothetical protein